jgi:PadR family transcriptional regulator, regulatory protein AphA
MDVRTICLGILTRGDHTGYEIKKHFEDGGCQYFIEASFGSIYPALNKLTEEGLVSVREEAQVKRPDRKVYSVTEEGRRAFRDALFMPVSEDRNRSPFLFAMLFADLLPEVRLAAMYDEYVARAEERLSQIDKGGEPETKGERFVRDFGHAIYRAMLDHLRSHREMFVLPKAAE